MYCDFLFRKIGNGIYHKTDTDAEQNTGVCLGQLIGEKANASAAEGAKYCV